LNQKHSKQLLCIIGNVGCAFDIQHKFISAIRSVGSPILIPTPKAILLLSFCRKPPVEGADVSLVAAGSYVDALGDDVMVVKAFWVDVLVVAASGDGAPERR